MSLINRIGTFFILLGITLLALFLLSDLAKAPACNFLVMGAAALGLGIFLWFRDPVKPGPPPERFRTLRRMFGGKPPKK